jgi:hypothetical protein
MRSGYAAERSPMLMTTPSYRQQAGRRRLAVIVVLALASGVIGALVQPTSKLASAPTTGPFSYFPSE